MGGDCIASSVLLPCGRRASSSTQRMGPHSFLTVSPRRPVGPPPRAPGLGLDCFFAASPRWLAGPLLGHRRWGCTATLPVSPAAPGLPLVHRAWRPHCFPTSSPQSLTVPEGRGHTASLSVLSNRSTSPGFLIFVKFLNYLSPWTSSLNSDPSCGTPSLLLFLTLLYPRV